MQASLEEIQALYRALEERDKVSWDQVWRHWNPRVARWVRRHPQFRYTGEDADYFVNRAFEKLWRAVTPAKLARFGTPSQLVQYFKLCVHSVILDELRGLPGEAASIQTMADVPAPGAGVEEAAVQTVRRDELWRTVAAHVRSHEERLLVEAALVRGLPAREIAKRYPGAFANVEEIYRLKRNLMDRLSRDKRLRDFISG